MIADETARQLGKWLLPAIILGGIAVWSLAHFWGKPCAPVSVLFGLVQYTKAGECPSTITPKEDAERRAELERLRDQIKTGSELSRLPHLIADDVWLYRGYRLREASNSIFYAGSCPQSPCFRIEIQGIVESHGTQGQEVVVTTERLPKGTQFCLGATEISPKKGTVAIGQLISSNPPSWRLFVPLVKGTARYIGVGGEMLTLTVRDANINDLALDATIRHKTCDQK
jgi:hypothetical protein